MSQIQLSESLSLGNEGPVAMCVGSIPLETEDRLMRAALTCIARVGVRKTTLDEVAREAGCARATLYRYYPGKDAVLAAVVDREARCMASRVCVRAAGCDTFEDAVVELVLTSTHELLSHPALTFVAKVEPEFFLRCLTFEGSTPFFHRTVELFAPALERFLDRESAERVVELLARLVLSYSFSPGDFFDFSREDSVRELVRHFVMPGFRSENSDAQEVSR